MTEIVRPLLPCRPLYLVSTVLVVFVFVGKKGKPVRTEGARE